MKIIIKTIVGIRDTNNPNQSNDCGLVVAIFLPLLKVSKKVFQVESGCCETPLTLISLVSVFLVIKVLPIL